VRALPRGAPLSEIGLAVRADKGNVLTDRLVELALSKGKTH
jgi:hypothetical protein